jgi:hypothetical protein
MATTQQTTVENKVQAKERRSWSVALDGGKDERLTVALEKRRDGTWRTFARVTVGTGKARKHVRGATAQHADERQGRAAQEALVARATKDGWRRREPRGGGFAARPDAFTLATLPKPTAKK